MARKQADKPFHKIMVTRATLRMFVEYGDAALDGKTFQEFAAEVQDCMELLMDFRNMVNAMVTFDEAPAEAVLPYLPTDLLAPA